MITFECHAPGCSPSRWNGSIAIIKTGDPCEAEVTSRGNSFHVIVGKHSYGNYLCIPNWNVGSELADLTDSFWNEERLRTYTKLKKIDACTVATALSILANHAI
jgi:hypothetical protein